MSGSAEKGGSLSRKSGLIMDRIIAAHRSGREVFQKVILRILSRLVSKRPTRLLYPRSSRSAQGLVRVVLTRLTAGASAAFMTVARRLRFAPQGFEFVPGLELIAFKDLREALAFFSFD
jgi:hypothetical protein